VVLILPEPHKQSATNNHREHPPPTRQNLSTVTQDNRQRMHKLICRENREKKKSIICLGMISTAMTGHVTTAKYHKSQAYLRGGLYVRTYA